MLSGNTWAGAAPDSALEIEAWQSEFARVHHKAIAEPRRRTRASLMRRALVAADVAGLTVAFVTSLLVFMLASGPGQVDETVEIAIFVATLPVWILLAGLHRLYDKDFESADHSTVDDLVGVIQVVTIGAWTFLALDWTFGTGAIHLGRLFTFWALAIALVCISRAIARSLARRSDSFTERTLVVGAGEVGQLIARKIRLHPEYGLRLVGFLDSDPRVRRQDVSGIAVMGGQADLEQIVSDLNVDRLIVAFSREPDDETMQTLRGLRDRNIAIDVVPRLFDLIGPHSSVHTVEGLPLVSVSPLRLSRSSFLVKRVSTSWHRRPPARNGSAVRVRGGRGSVAIRPGPVFFRQTRLGMDMRRSRVLKFRTMRVDTDEAVHRDYIAARCAGVGRRREDGLYKLEREDSVTRVGRWLRQHEPRRAPAARERAPRRDVARRPASLHPLRGRALRAAPVRALPRPAGHHRPLAGERARALDVRRGARHGRRLRAQLVVRPGSPAALQTRFALLRHGRRRR